MEQGAISAPYRANWAITVTLALSMLLAALGTSIANIALPTLAAAFAAPFPLVQGVVVAHLAALTVSTIIVGRLGDRHGLKRMHLAGLGLFAVSSLLCGLLIGSGFSLRENGTSRKTRTLRILTFRMMPVAKTRFPRFPFAVMMV